MKMPIVAEANLPAVGRVRYLDLGFFDRDGVGALAAAEDNAEHCPYLGTADRVLTGRNLRPAAPPA